MRMIGSSKSPCDFALAGSLCEIEVILFCSLFPCEINAPSFRIEETNRVKRFEAHRESVFSLGITNLIAMSLGIFRHRAPGAIFGVPILKIIPNHNRMCLRVVGAAERVRTSSRAFRIERAL